MDHRKAVFVFGSNLGGFHGAGAAKYALNYKGAILRQGVGRQGQSYAIPTKDAEIRHTLPLGIIRNYVEDFIEYAKENSDTLTFQITRIGCGLAGLKDEDIAPIFIKATDNCWFDTAWKPWLGNQNYWGTF